MGFMQPQVYETDYILVEGPLCNECVPCDVVDYHPTTEMAGGQAQPIPSELRDYCENNEFWSIERKHGFVGRMSAPGYMDATDWTWGDTEAEVTEQLKELFGCENCGELECEECAEDSEVHLASFGMEDDGEPYPESD